MPDKLKNGLDTKMSCAGQPTGYKCAKLKQGGGGNPDDLPAFISRQNNNIDVMAKELIKRSTLLNSPRTSCPHVTSHYPQSTSCLGSLSSSHFASAGPPPRFNDLVITGAGEG